ncbi:trimeric LpxA-like protein [Penicillium capsulatum]|uniref:Trimeric LpxA-like protein n=1 Tax=Penicillium capsulatum TaxID=69766 RepID=A0A9W9HYV8_9EURO|nr:trimeric LpxA-like protein [Penicillium capsulatum]KAJ6116738.1 trimeric LpxA-like protein [Penicillium capsulatum]
MLSGIDEKENLARMSRGELYFAFSPELVAARKRCARAVRRLNNAGDLTRRATDEEEGATLHAYPWIECPINIDYGTKHQSGEVGSNVFINFNCTFLDTCTITIGSRTLIGPNVSFFSGTHPLDPDLRNGTNGPELGAKVTISEDGWIAGNVTILPGVTIGDGSTVGAGSVVTKDVPPCHVVAGNPARILRNIERQGKTVNGAGA